MLGPCLRMRKKLEYPPWGPNVDASILAQIVAISKPVRLRPTGERILQRKDAIALSVVGFAQ